MVVEFKQTHYTGGNMFMVVCGDVEHEHIANVTNQHFSHISKEPTNGK